MENPDHGDITLKRKDWDQWDPTLMAEAAFAVANIFRYVTGFTSQDFPT